MGKMPMPHCRETIWARCPCHMAWRDLSRENRLSKTPSDFNRCGPAGCFGAGLCAFYERKLQDTRRPDEKHALEQLRLMTRNEVIPADSILLPFERDYPNSRVAALARLTRARGRLKGNDFAGAAELLSSDSILEKSGIVDYALFMRARALDQGGRTVQARADYERIAREYPRSLRAREALLLDATILQSSGQ